MILSGEKKLLHKSSLKTVDVGNYPEISVKSQYNDFAERAEIKPYMPPKINKGRQCDKEYFWNIVNSLCEEEVEAIIDHANNQRNLVGDGELKQESITMTDEMVQLMQKYPWISVSTF